MPINVKVSLLEPFGAFENTVWPTLDHPITRKEVQKILDSGKMPRQYTDLWSATRRQHAGRIAYFVLNGWSDPIDIDVGVPGHGRDEPYVEDGNHRLAAAIFRGDPEIAVDFPGCIAHFERLFNVSAA